MTPRWEMGMAKMGASVKIKVGTKFQNVPKGLEYPWLSKVKKQKSAFNQGRIQGGSDGGARSPLEKFDACEVTSSAVLGCPCTVYTPVYFLSNFKKQSIVMHRRPRRIHRAHTIRFLSNFRIFQFSAPIFGRDTTPAPGGLELWKPHPKVYPLGGPNYSTANS